MKPELTAATNRTILEAFERAPSGSMDKQASEAFGEVTRTQIREGSFAFKIIPPEATIKYGMPNSCQNGSCHTDKSTQWAIDEYEKFYNKKDKTLADIVKDIK